MFISSAFAQTAGTAAAGSSLGGMVLQLLLIFAIFYFLLIRPQQKRLKEHEARLRAIKRGDKVVTGGGIIAKIVEAKDGEDEIKAEIADGVKVTISRATVREVISEE